jgi:ligand-binding sensor domain-containing protein
LTAAIFCVLGAASANADGGSGVDFLSWQDGMSQTTVFSIVTDDRGYVWMATEDGLNRFDGESFDIYRNEPGDPSSLPANTVRALRKDEQGNIWVATEGGGLARWDAGSNSFTRFTLGGSFARALLTDKGGQIWVALRDSGVDRLDPESGEVTHFRHDPASEGSLSDDNVYALVQSIDGTVWVGTNSGLDYFDSDSQSFVHIELRKNHKATAVRSLFADRSGILWVGTKDRGLVRLDPSTGELSDYRHDPYDTASISDDCVQQILEDGLGNLWVGTAEGLDLLDREEGEFLHFVPEDARVIAGSGAITSLFEDEDQLLWVGTELGGVSLWKNPSEADDIDDPFEVHSVDVVTSFVEDNKGHLFVGTVGEGLIRIDRKTGDEVRFSNDPESSKSLSDDRVMSLFKDSRGRVWVGTQRGGLNLYSSRKENFKNFRSNVNNPNSISANGIMTITEDSAGTLWIGTFGGGLNSYPGRGGKFTAYRHDPANPESLGNDRITAILESEDGRLWVGTDGAGLNLFDPVTGTSQRFPHDPNDPSSLPADTVCALYRDALGTLWVATRGGGLARMNTPPSAAGGPEFTSFSERDGLPNSVVYGIQPDEAGNLWLSTNLGLSQFDPVALTFTNFDVNDGLQANEFNFGAAYRSATGELFFGGINGYNSFVPAESAAGSDRTASGAQDDRSSSDGLVASGHSNSVARVVSAMAAF